MYKQRSNDSTRLQYVTRLLKQAEPDKLLSRDTTTKLEALASARVGLSLAADWLHRVYCLKENIGGALSHMAPFMEALQAVCDQDQLKWPR